jgi:hypothetical protein
MEAEREDVIPSPVAAAAEVLIKDLRFGMRRGFFIHSNIVTIPSNNYYFYCSSPILKQHELSIF